MATEPRICPNCRHYRDDLLRYCTAAPVGVTDGEWQMTIEARSQYDGWCGPEGRHYEPLPPPPPEPPKKPGLWEKFLRSFL